MGLGDGRAADASGQVTGWNHVVAFGEVHDLSPGGDGVFVRTLDVDVTFVYQLCEQFGRRLAAFSRDVGCRTRRLSCRGLRSLGHLRCSRYGAGCVGKLRVIAVFEIESARIGNRCVPPATASRDGKQATVPKRAGGDLGRRVRRHVLAGCDPRQHIKLAGVQRVPLSHVRSTHQSSAKGQRLRPARAGNHATQRMGRHT